MADRNTLMLLEAIRLEIRALIEAGIGIPHNQGRVRELQRRGNSLSRMGFDGVNLAADEKEALGYE